MLYFFSEIDPNYRIKGSRDPLGFQSLWANAGHRVVLHLSTVSVNLRDFMILAYATWFYGDEPENRFLSFFLKFEQACAYARRIHNNEGGFNGIDFVNKRKDNPSFQLSLNNQDTLLSNQRNYGIYGKYIRPFRDIGIKDDPSFKDVILASLRKTNWSALKPFIDRLKQSDKLIIQKEDLKLFAELLATLTIEEKELYRNRILKVSDQNHPQNNLYNLVKHDPEICLSPFNLHVQVDRLRKSAQISSDLDQALENIRFTDKVLLPLNRCFVHLLSNSEWSANQIRKDEFIRDLPGSANYDFQDETVRELNRILDFSKSDLVDETIRRNALVSQQRGSAAWIVKEKENYKVVYGENGSRQAAVDFENDYEFPYFLNNYFSLFNQIELLV